jgi:hypothetical protein
MKTFAKCLILGSLALLMNSCVTSQIASLNSQDENDIEVFLTSKPTKNYTELAYIEASGGIFTSKRKLLKKLKNTAKKNDANAVVNVKFGYTFWWPYVEGVAIKYQ